MRNPRGVILFRSDDEIWGARQQLGNGFSILRYWMPWAGNPVMERYTVRHTPFRLTEDLTKSAVTLDLWIGPLYSIRFEVFFEQHGGRWRAADIVFRSIS